MTSPSGLKDVQEQDALELLGNFGKGPRWVAPSHIELGETHLLIVHSTATRRPFLPSIVECGPALVSGSFSSQLLSLYQPTALPGPPSFFAPRSSTFFTPSSLYQPPGRNSIVRLDSCHILLNVNKHTEHSLLHSISRQSILRLRLCLGP